MIWFRSSHSQSAEFAEAIRPELRDIPVPPPGDDLLNRILASRQAGARVILPDVNQSHSTRGSRVVIPAAIVAAFLLLLLPFRSSLPPEHQGDATSFSRFATEWISGSFALAQPDASRGSYSNARVVFSHPERLSAKQLRYLRTWTDSSHKVIGRVNGSVSVSPSVNDGVAAWLVVARNEGSRNGKHHLILDSIVIARDNFRLLRHTALEEPYSRYSEIRIDQKFTGNTISGSMHAKGMNVPDAARPIARVLQPAQGPFIIDALGPVALGAVDLHNGWSASASVVGWAVRDDDVILPVTLAVTGSEAVTVPAGRFECWRLAIHFPGGSVSYWVRKSDGVGIRGTSREDGGITREVVLVSG